MLLGGKVGYREGPDGSKVGQYEGDKVVGLTVGSNEGFRVGLYDGLTEGKKEGVEPTKVG